MTNATDTTVRTSVSVEAPIQHAFKVFTEGFDTWWPRTHHIGTPDMAEAVLEQRLDGRWYERGVDGSECEWGRVLAWDPPNHIAVSWHLNAEYKYDPDPETASRVDIRFFAEDDDRTRVELEHSALDRHGADWAKLRTGISSEEGGWPTILAGFADAAQL
jgi:uncharacterized protein YndB with AHSA1/START domain